jgi:iron only hydrogenase large subunit-like protein
MLYTHSGGGSGGYLENVLFYAAKEIFNYNLTEIKYEVLKNQDFKETSLVIDGETKLKFVIAYGFRNIQNIVQKLKKGSCSYQFIEIMACPSGCLNGGGQIRDEKSILSKQLFSKVNDMYNSVPIKLPDDNTFLKKVYENENEEILKEKFHTTYHEIEKITTSMIIKW